MHVHDCVTPQLSKFYALVNSKIQHPPQATCGHLNFLRLGCLNAPLGGQIVFKCPTQVPHFIVNFP